MDQGQPLTWDDIAGLEFAKKTIQEIVVWPMLRPYVISVFGVLYVYKIVYLSMLYFSMSSFSVAFFLSIMSS